MVTYDDDGARACLQEQVDRLERLVADLKWLSIEESPPEECLRAAPLLNPYTIIMAQVPCLGGSVDKHPILGGPKAIVTSPICFMAEDHTWARTYSRYYRLGRPLTDDFSIN